MERETRKFHMENALQKLFIQSYLNQCSMRHHNDFAIDASKLKTASHCKFFFIKTVANTDSLCFLCWDRRVWPPLC